MTSYHDPKQSASLSASQHGDKNTQQVIGEVRDRAQVIGNQINVTWDTSNPHLLLLGMMGLAFTYVIENQIDKLSSKVASILEQIDTQGRDNWISHQGYSIQETLYGVFPDSTGFCGGVLYKIDMPYNSVQPQWDANLELHKHMYVPVFLEEGQSSIRSTYPGLQKIQTGLHSYSNAETWSQLHINTGQSFVTSTQRSFRPVNIADIIEIFDFLDVPNSPSIPDIPQNPTSIELDPILHSRFAGQAIVSWVSSNYELLNTEFGYSADTSHFGVMESTRIFSISLDIDPLVASGSFEVSGPQDAFSSNEFETSASDEYGMSDLDSHDYNNDCG